MRRPLRAAAAAAAIALATLIPATAHAATTHPARSTAGLAGAALNWAEGHALGHPYVFGGTGPGYDCSGLVMEAYGHADGIWLPHNTGAMLASGRLRQVPISSAPRGALLFFGTGHVELNTRWHDTSFGAQQTGTVIWWHHWFPGSWEPTAAYVVVPLPGGTSSHRHTFRGGVW